MTDNRADQKPPAVKDVPIGLDAERSRSEFDSMGTIDVPADRYWGAQTQRSGSTFRSGNDRMPKEVYHAYGYVKKACALVNAEEGRLPLAIASHIPSVQVSGLPKFVGIFGPFSG